MTTSPAGPLETGLQVALREQFSPSHLDVINESSGHTSKPGAETHFKVIVVSESFEGQGLVQRHRAVNSAARTQLDGGVHALSIQPFTSQEWAARGGTVPASPVCPKS
jgi:BolA protein